MKKLLCCICFWFPGILALAAQTDAPGETKRVAGRTAWFACISIPDGLENPVKVLSGKDLTEVKLEKFLTSGPVKIPDDGFIRIVRVVPNPENQEKPKYLILAEAKIPESVREALIILSPLTKPDGDRIFQAQVQDLATFKGGDRLYINLSDSQIRIKLGNSNVIVAPKQANIYTSPNLAQVTNMPIMYEFYHPAEKQWKIISASTVVVRPTRREICVFNNGNRIGNIQNHKILFPVQSKEP